LVLLKREFDRVQQDNQRRESLLSINNIHHVKLVCPETLLLAPQTNHRRHEMASVGPLDTGLPNVVEQVFTLV
jgi:hypothetical protein